MSAFIKKYFNIQSTRFRIVLGLSGMLVSLLLLASMIGLVPDRHGAIRDGHARLAEAIAVNTSIFITSSDIRRIKANLGVVVDRNDELLSAALRRNDGQMIVVVGDHPEQWQTQGEEGKLSESQVTVPIYEGSDEWGQVELDFEPLLPSAWYGQLVHPLFLLLGFILLTSFIVFYLYLGKMLKQLDPSQAIPDRVRSALDTMAEGLLVIDAKQNVVLANQSFATLVGESAETLIGRQISQFHWCDSDGESIDTNIAPWTHALADSVSRTSEMIRMKRDGTENKTFMTNCSPVLSGSGKASGVLISFDDITELEQKEVELRLSKEEADKANRFKSEFLANMSHEIRTPMNAILGFAEVLKRGYDRDSRDSIRYLNTITSSGTHLLSLINDILDLSKVEAGRIDVETIQTPVHSVIHEVIQIMKAKADEKGIQLEYKPDGPLPEYIETDAGKLRQIITNIAGNAIKFTDKGGVTVITKLNKGRKDSVLEINVIDTGIGMSQEQAAEVFNPFKQADSSITRRYGGTGLGLTISKRFAQALGGDISITSEPGVGSAFNISVSTGAVEDVRLLSVEEILSAQWNVKETQARRWKFPLSRVLAVDDAEENRELINVVLGNAGIEVVTAGDGQEALDYVTNSKFDVVLMDVQMPVMDGYTAAGKIREIDTKLPVFALTADAMAGAEQKCLDAGYSDYLAKPIDIDVLLERMAELLGGELLDDDEVAASTQVKASGENKEKSESGKIYSSLPMPNQKYRDIVQKFIIRLEKQLSAIDAAWSDRDYVELKRLGHWLKGSAGSVGFAAFVEPAAEFEQFAIHKDDVKLEAAIKTIHSLFKRIDIQPGDGCGEPLMNEQTTSPVNKNGSETGKIYTSLPMSNQKYREIVQKFIIRLEKQLSVINSAWADRDYAELKRLGHWLKGSAGSVGFTDFIEPAAEFEQLAINKDDAKLEAAINTLHSLFKRIDIQSDNDNRISQKDMHNMKEYVIPEKVTNRLIETNPRLKLIAEKFNRQLEESLNNIDTAIVQKDFDDIRKFAYWLKASGGTIGYGEFTEPATDLEEGVKEKRMEIIKHTVGIIKEIQHRIVLPEKDYETGANLHVNVVGK